MQKATTMSAPFNPPPPAWLRFSAEIATPSLEGTRVHWDSDPDFRTATSNLPPAASGNQLSLFDELSSSPRPGALPLPSEEAVEPGSFPFIYSAQSMLPVADMRLLKRLYDVVKANLANQEFRVEDLASELGFCPRQLQRKVRDLLGKTPLEYIRAMRLQQARDLLKGGVYTTVKEVAAAVGFSRNYFHRLYHRHYGHVASKDLKTSRLPAVKCPVLPTTPCVPKPFSSHGLRRLSPVLLAVEPAQAEAGASS